MPRFLIIAYSTYVRDGRVKRHAEALAARGDHVDVICLGGPLLRSGNGVNVIGIEMPRYRGASRAAYVRSYLYFFAKAATTSFRLSRPRPYDAAIICSMPDAMVACSLPLRLFGTRIVLDVHDTMPELYLEKFGGVTGALGARMLMLEERVSAGCADRVLAVHDLHRMRLEAAGIPVRKIRTVFNSPDPKIFPAPLNGKAAVNGSASKGAETTKLSTIVCHGTITRRLGLDVALRAMDLLGDVAVRLIVIGNGDYLGRVRSLAAQLRLEDRVQFVPPVPIEQLPAVLKQADVGLVPNPANPATHLMLPVKLLEYATLGIPVIAARLRTIEHYFGDGAVSVFEAGSPSALAAAIRELCLNRELAAMRASRALSVAESLGWKRQSGAFFDAIDSLLLAKDVAAAQSVRP